MSVREDLVIQADNVTIVQGEKAKDYNVIITSTDGTLLSGIPITIAFYNNDYSFEREATTNQYGVASVPIYLSGDAWFVDVHFKGNEQYKPQQCIKVTEQQNLYISLIAYIKAHTHIRYISLIP